MVRLYLVSLSGLALDETSLNEDKDIASAKWTNLDTAYNGRCRSFRLGKRLRTGIFVNFVLDSPVDIYFMHPGNIIKKSTKQY